MYIWVAIDVNEQVGELREKAENYVSTHGLSSPTLTLPFHISLKISFQIPDNRCQEEVQDILDRLAAESMSAAPEVKKPDNADELDEEEDDA